MDVTSPVLNLGNVLGDVLVNVNTSHNDNTHHKSLGTLCFAECQLVSRGRGSREGRREGVGFFFIVRFFLSVFFVRFFFCPIFS